MNKTDKIAPFELPQSQNLHLIIKSLWMFEEARACMTDSDEFTWDKDENDVFVLSHHALKYDVEKPILAIHKKDLEKISMKELHNYILYYVKYAWVERLI